MRISALVLAGGESKRFGKNKLFEEFKGKPLILWTLELVKSVEFHERIIVLNPKNLGLYIQMGIDGFNVIVNEGYREGMASSIRVGMSRAIDSRSDAVMIFLSDMPFIKTKTILRLMNVMEENHKPIVIPRYGMKRGNPVLIRREVFHLAMGLKGDIGMRRIVENRKDLVEFVQVLDPGVRMDIDEMTDVEDLERGYLGSRNSEE